VSSMGESWGTSVESLRLRTAKVYTHALDPTPLPPFNGDIISLPKMAWIVLTRPLSSLPMTLNRI